MSGRTPMDKHMRALITGLVSHNEREIIALTTINEEFQRLLEDDWETQELPACTVPNCSVCATIKHNEPAFRYKKRSSP